MILVQTNGFNLRCMAAKYQTPAVVLAALNQNPNARRYANGKKLCIQ
jgi:hypothetical protein